MLKRRIPTFIGILLLLSGAIGGVIFLNQGTGFLPRAAPEYIPQKITVTNLSDTGFVVSWVTQETTIGFVKLGPSANQLITIYVDERDQLTGESGEYRTHYVSITGLEPQTEYHFKLGSHGKQLYDNNGQPLSLTTSAALPAPPSANTIYGTVMNPSQTTQEGAIVYLSFPDDLNLTPLSALVKQNGNWAISLSKALIKNTAQFGTIDPQTTVVNLLVRSTISDGTNVTSVVGSAQPLPPITLGQDQDYRSTSSPEVVNPTPIPESRFTLESLSVTEPDGSRSFTVDTFEPTLTGKAPPGTVITINLHSPTVYTASINSDETGRWTYTPPKSLEPGEHTVSLAYADQKGVLHTLSRTFTVRASTSVGYTATPSAVIASPTPLPTQRPTPSLAAATPTSKPLQTITPTVTLAPMPTAGITAPTLFILGTGLLLLVFGLAFSF